MLDPAQHGKRRRVAGVMSGTSLDGIDAAIATFEGSGASVRIVEIQHAASPYPDAVREALLRNSKAESSSVVEISQLNVLLANLYAESILQLDSPVDLVGMHGQTVQHVPVATDCCGRPTRSTLQIGDPSTVANLLGVPTVGDFRLADMAHGGQGAPLVSYFDAAILGHETEDRIALNLGGIANFTLLPARKHGDPTDDETDVHRTDHPLQHADRRDAERETRAILAMDTGPANMVLDALAGHFLSAHYDARGAAAARGIANEDVLAKLLDDDYFHQPPPKSTGRERYGNEFVRRLIREMESRGRATPEDIFATAAELTVRSIHLAYTRFVRETSGTDGNVDRLIVSGGGTRNDHIMQRLRDLFDPVPVSVIDDFGIPSVAKEALCFALLAHEFVNGVATGMPEVTGAASRSMLGKLCLPAPNDSRL